ncbi:SLBB domain-containing protein [Desulfosediminicola flagellatus]|uniref:SLBB domain-containing protein n=1 Tax=Desulfosediminicola flagellatus TaxID=2569541 RepID=UPI00142E9AAC|nr:SLBB domain-containing protein [Desulfosediminicola flagellatus]
MVFYVSGEVNKPDAYKLEENLTVRKTTTKAGGFSGHASKNIARIIRKSNGREQFFDKIEMNAPILQEDVILVPESIF